MALTSANVYGDLTNKPYINGLMSGYKWGLAGADPDISFTSPLTIEFKFSSGLISAIGQQLGIGDQWNVQAEREAARSAMTAYENIANIKFSEDSGSPNISWVSQRPSNTIGYEQNQVFDTAEVSYSPGVPGPDFFPGYIFLNNSFYLDDLKKLVPGSYYYLAFLRGLGKAIGLKDAHELKEDPYVQFPGVSDSKDRGAANLNAGPWTVMTDNAKGGVYSPADKANEGFLVGLGAFDIAAVQYLYGPNTGYEVGNNVYPLDGKRKGFQCIWDNGGTDAISAETSESSVNIDLRNATLLEGEGGGGYVSKVSGAYKGFTIAYNYTGSCVIENAKGSGFDDTLRGNAGNNLLEGLLGNDTLIGGGGSDTLKGGDGVDTVVFAAGVGGYAFSNLGDKSISVKDESGHISIVEDIEFFEFEGEQNLSLKKLGLDEILDKYAPSPKSPSGPEGPSTVGNSPGGSSNGESSAGEAGIGSGASDGGGATFTPSVLGDTITGNDSANFIASTSPGRFFLVGKGGADRFGFTVYEQRTYRNADVVVDFSTAEGDSLSFSRSAFPGIGSLVRLKVVTGKKAFRKSKRAPANFVYRLDAGELFFNQNGKRGSWGKDGGIVGVFEGLPLLQSNNFVIA